jgi:hypothetical protein
MKTHSLLAIAFLAVLATALVLPLSGSTYCLMLTIAGVGAVLAADYGRVIPRVRVPAEVVPFEPTGSRAPLGRAA